MIRPSITNKDAEMIVSAIETLLDRDLGQSHLLTEERIIIEEFAVKLRLLGVKQAEKVRYREVIKEIRDKNLNADLTWDKLSE